MGCMGMTHDEFCKCTFPEFESIYKAWHEMEESRYRSAWERGRTLATIIIQPHLSKKITPRQLLPLPWDKQKSNPTPEAPELTPEQRRQRFEEVARRLGDEINP